MQDLEKYVVKNMEIINNNFTEVAADLHNLFEKTGQHSLRMDKISGRVTRNGWGLAALFGLGYYAYKKLEGKIQNFCDEKAKND